MSPTIGTKSPKSKSKYGNVKTGRDGMLFDSEGEANRWSDLKTLEQAGEIRNLQRQLPYPLVVNGVYVCEYVADFDYEVYHPGIGFSYEWWEIVTEDFKGYETEVFRIKAKLFKACYARQIKIIKNTYTGKEVERELRARGVLGE